MFTPENAPENEFLIEVEEVTNDAENNPMLVGRVVSGSIDLSMQDRVEVHGETLGWVFTKIKKAVRFSRLGEVLDENMKRVAIGLLGDPVKTISPMEKLQIGTSLPKPLADKTVDERKFPGIRFKDLVVSGCLIGTALFFLPWIVLLLSTIGILGYLLAVILLGFLAYGLIILFRATGRWLRLQRNQASTTGRVLDRRLNTWEDRYGGIYTTCATIIEFMAQQADGSTKSYVLSFDRRKLYEGLDIGSSVNVRYAVEDPRIAQIEGE